MIASALALWPRADLEALALEVVEGEPHLNLPALADPAVRRALSRSGLALEIQDALRAAEAAADYSGEDD